MTKHGKPVANTFIQLSGPGTAGVAAPNGTSIFKNTPQGTYSIKISAKGYTTLIMPLTVSHDMGGEIAGLTGVTILLEKSRTTALPLLKNPTRPQPVHKESKSSKKHPPINLDACRFMILKPGETCH